MDKEPIYLLVEKLNLEYLKYDFEYISDMFSHITSNIKELKTYYENKKLGEFLYKKDTNSFLIYCNSITEKYN
jgi:hypothetical protein